MRVLMLSWEYPPRSIGGLSTHVYNISHSLQGAGHEIHVVTCGNEKSKAFEVEDGINIHRVFPISIEKDNLIEWINQLNYAMIEASAKLLNNEEKFDLIHAHDWHVAFAAKTLKQIYCLPLITTFHSTEYGRNNGIYTDLHRHIASIEALLAKESSKIICCSEYMKDQVSSLYDIDKNNIQVIPNGVFEAPKSSGRINIFRRAYAKDDEKIVLYIGRHIYLKGIHHIIDAIPTIVSKIGNIKFIISGTGPMTEDLKYKAQAMGISDKIIFTGYIDEKVKQKLYRAADVFVIPSLYEPFGNVALEAMTMGCPVVASATGGLSEIVDNNVTGKLFNPGYVHELADSIVELLNDDVLRNGIIEKALDVVKDSYTWEKASELTSEAYISLRVKKKRTPVRKNNKKPVVEETVLVNTEDISEKSSERKKSSRSGKKKAESDISELL
ncbi:glycosyltransferase family 4 protein [Clostridium thermarum]|uniref:glycosyltransferase family 4 protein n=1 Tax=Clostridium thermarum TaxID=1716543 RepID=UPI00111E0267|nr:glycosyltransferase family 4 protein [Clostridium thermarum]